MRRSGMVALETFTDTIILPSVNLKTVTRLNPPAARPAADHQLLIQAVAPVADSPLLVLSRRIADAGCNLIESRVATVGADVSVLLLAKGGWDAIAKLENALTRVGRSENVHLLSYRTQTRDQQSHLLPYMIEVVAGHKLGAPEELTAFFYPSSISIAPAASMLYQAMQTWSDTIKAELMRSIP